MSVLPKPSSDQPVVSVIMNCYNGAAYIAEAIDSVLTQTYPHWELVFWDNQSTDASAAIVQAYTDPRIKYFYAPEFTPLGAARNLAIAEATGSLIAFLDSDDIWMPEKLQLQVPLFDDPKIGIVISDTIFFNGAGAEKQLYGGTPPPTGDVFSALLRHYFISLETAIVRQTALETLDSLFDPRFNAIEEYDLFIRLCLEWNLGYVGQVLAKWRVHGDSWTFTRSNLFGSERRLFVTKLTGLVPNFQSRYPEEYRSLTRMCDFEDARGLWRDGDRRAARRLLKEYRGDGARWLVTFLLSYFPYAVFTYIEKTRRIRPQ